MSDQCPFLVLGCFGRSEDGFVFCPSLDNRILKLDDSLVESEKIWEYLDNLQLLDRPIYNYNAIKHMVFNIKDRFNQVTRPIWSETEFNRIERFIIMHKECGIYARLFISNPEEIVEKPNVVIDQSKINLALKKIVRKPKPIVVPTRRVQRSF